MPQQNKKNHSSSPKCSFLIKEHKPNCKLKGMQKCSGNYLHNTITALPLTARLPLRKSAGTSKYTTDFKWTLQSRGPKSNCFLSKRDASVWQPCHEGDPQIINHLLVPTKGNNNSRLQRKWNANTVEFSCAETSDKSFGKISSRELYYEVFPLASFIVIAF